MNAAFFNNWTNQARKGVLILNILNDIRNYRMYGYEIEKRFCKSTGLIISEGTIYDILRRLKQNGLVKTTQAKSPDGPKRNYYRLTEAGTRTLSQMNMYWQALAMQADAIEKGEQKRH